MIIEEIIAEKPHLAEPFRVYERVQRFIDAVRSLGLPQDTEQNAYPPEFAALVINRFSSVLELPEGSLSPLCQALELREIDFTRLPLLEVPAFSLPYAEDDLSTILFLISKPFFVGRHEACGIDDLYWEGGRCPLCNAQPALALLAGNRRRMLYCSFCGTTGSFKRVQCPVCLNLNTAQLHSYTFTGEEDYSVQICDVCRSYVKTVAGSTMSRIAPDIADLISLPLDILIQQKGYRRRSPNPIGLMKMSLGS